MRVKKHLLFFTLLFLFFMLFLTLFSNRIHNRMLVQVEIFQPKMRMFCVKSGDGNEKVMQKCYAVPDWMENYNLYIVEIGEKNGQERTFARSVQIELGKKEGLFCPILDEEYFGEPFILRSDNSISDGEEVYVKNWRSIWKNK